MRTRTPDLDAWVAAMAPLCGLDIAPDDQAGVKANLKTAAKMAALLEKVPLEDGTEPAPVFRA